MWNTFRDDMRSLPLDIHHLFSWPLVKRGSDFQKKKKEAFWAVLAFDFPVHFLRYCEFYHLNKMLNSWPLELLVITCDISLFKIR